MTIKTCMLTLALCCAAITLNAQNQYRDNIFSKKLSNGLTIVVVEDNTVPLAALSMTFKNGAFTESPNFSGTAAVYNYMLLKGNRDYGNSDQAGYRTSQLAMIKGSSVSEEKTVCNITMPGMFVDEGLRYMNSAMRFPIIDATELEKAKNVTDKELQNKEVNPYFQLNKVAGEHIWGSLANRKTAISTHQNIHAITLSLLDTIQKRYYYPNNALLIVAGRVEHAHIFEKAAEFFSSWEASPDNPFKKWPVPPFKPIAKTDFFTVESVNANAPHILISWQGPNTQNDIPSTYAADVFSYIMTQNSSKLNKALVQSGLALGVDFNYLTLGQGGPITFNIRPNPAKIKECLAEVKKQIALFDTDDYITNEQIETAVRKLEISRIRQEEVTSDFANQLSFWWASATLDYFFNYTDNLQKVKRSNLRAYVRKYIKNKPYCAGLLVNPTMRAQFKTDDFFTAN